MGAAAFFAIGSIYEFIEAKNSEGKILYLFLRETALFFG
ncbi:hypothetical protein LEP1GSC115_1883 [Leptospira interrogans serovar Australis str. 200703203]|uniref:Uncharacterized protein n=1 Tax=Leptospira interrogans serovar Australis str. 200703203 TaxID=1085541 RepID=N1UES4_LEPIR|nr:hypothetical protein LEP1GSC115_1883 [Leptospira interrogans serovar Australis str. 200703203]